jgi:Glucodextranase, domain B
MSTVHLRFGIFGLALVAACSNDDTGGSVPSGVAVNIEPSLAFYPVSSQVSLTATVKDGAGTQLPDAKVTWTSDPADLATPGGDPGAFRLEKVGKVTFTACTVDNASDGKPACGQAMIEISPGAPVLVLTTPQPGAELGGDGKSTFPVQGKVTSGRATNVFINGVPVAVGADGSFGADVLATFGVNHVVVSADDGEDPEVRREFDVAFGAGYAPAVDATGAPAFSAPDAIVLDLGQRFFDDGTAVPLDAPHPVRLPDVADIVARVVAGMDIASKLPNPLIDGNGVHLTTTSATAGDLIVEAQLAGDGLDLFVRVGKLSLGTAGSLDLSGTTINLDGGVDASLSAYAHASIVKPGPTVPVFVNVGTFDVALETATGKFTDAQANAIFALASGYLRTTVEKTLKSALSGALQGSLPQALQSVFESLDTALANRTFNIDVPPLPKVGLTLDGHLNALDVAPFESMRAKLSLASKTDHPSAVHPKSRGVALADTSTADALFASPRSQLSVRLAALNGLLHGLWNSGLLEVPATDSIPVSVSAQLPPIVRLPRGGETSDLVVSLGELEMLPRGDEANGRLGVLFEAGLDVELVDDTLRLKLADKPVVTVWTIKAPPGPSIFTPQVLSDVLTNGLWPKLRDGITGALAIKLPLPPLGSIASVAPSLAKLTLATGLNRKLAYRNGFLVLDAKIEGTLP